MFKESYTRCNMLSQNDDLTCSEKCLKNHINDEVVKGGLRLNGQQKISKIDKPLVSVITVVFNGFNFLEETINSIANQSYNNIEHIVIDGGSTDGTLDIIRKYDFCIDYWVSEKDNGMYDALTKGFDLANGEIICYLNAGDLFVNSALNVVVDIFKNHDIKWVTGLRSVCNEKNQVFSVDTPFRYKKNLIRKGVYGKILPYIQQESTFWHRDLLSSISVDYLKGLHYAGDYYLWFCFSKVTSLSVVHAQLGIFKIHSGQLSECVDKYWHEVSSFACKKNIIDFFNILFESFFWILINRLRPVFLSKNIRYHKLFKKWF